MISLAQIKKLEEKVGRAVELIGRLRRENIALKAGVKASKKKTQDLEALAQSFKDDQQEIERTILSAMEKLEQLEDEVSESAESTSPQAASAGADKSPDRPSAVSGEKDPQASSQKDVELDIF